MFESQPNEERSACGIGFIASRNNTPSHQILRDALDALASLEHRGACGADQLTGDGSGIMTDIPFDLLGYERGSVAIAQLFVSPDPILQERSLRVFEDVFRYQGLEIIRYRPVPTTLSVLGQEAINTLPYIVQAVVKRPDHCRNSASFDRLLYTAKQMTNARLREENLHTQFFFTSLSATTIVYKALTRAQDLPLFYPDITHPRFITRFALFHRRFSTNTKTSWDKAQPFRLIGHNGEINTIAGNRSWAFSRQKSLGLRKDELLTHSGISDSGSLNEMVEALMYRSSIPRVEEILALMMPPGDHESDFFTFWSRAMEPWDGPACITYSDGQTIGARLDRNGFRPCRWALTESYFYLSSEAGAFPIPQDQILKKGALHAGSGVSMNLESGKLHFQHPGESSDYADVRFQARLFPIRSIPADKLPDVEHLAILSGHTSEDWDKVLVPMIADGKEPIGSMGDTARPRFLSTQPRSFFDYFYQQFAQVTNPPLDFIREKLVTDTTTYLGPKPNIFSPKELLPPKAAHVVASPILSLAQYAGLQASDILSVQKLSTTFERRFGFVGFRATLDALAEQAIHAVSNGVNLLILSDEELSWDKPAIPALLALRKVVNTLNDSGLRLDASVVVASSELIETHHVAALIGFGASAVCPWMSLSLARQKEHRSFQDKSPAEREKQLIKAYHDGVLKIMAKMGISVVRSYQSAKLFTPLGLGKGIINEFFPGSFSAIGGVELPQLVTQMLHQSSAYQQLDETSTAPHAYLYKEHNKGLLGEKHSMTNSRSKLVHELVRQSGIPLSDIRLYKAYLDHADESEPLSLRDLFQYKRSEQVLERSKVEPASAILSRFGSGAMSFGAISAEAQRDIILAMKHIGGRSNSGEGGENPFYHTEGLHASVKQVASGRFGVTATYLLAGEEIQIKIAQGAKPGEGGQLMAIKVDEAIAKARHSNPGTELISPPPQHDIYSIEDLKQLIYELKQLNPEAKVSVKLVSGAHIGTVAVGVVKAGADIIQISGGDGGTGAAGLSSMKHAGLPWEIGLNETHRALVHNQLRNYVRLRVDGGLHTGRDIIMAAILGADEFDFGKLLLVAQGCVMARICEKNTCPTGIATHDPKFKAKYKGTAEDIIRLMEYLADDVREHLSLLGISSMAEVIGKTQLLELNALHKDLIHTRAIDLSGFLAPSTFEYLPQETPFSDVVSPLNQLILNDVTAALAQQESIHLKYGITTADRATLATLSGAIARMQHEVQQGLRSTPFTGSIHVDFKGSAGQGFGVFLTEGVTVHLEGEANDSVCKAMSGGQVSIVPFSEARFDPSENAIIGNCALYGATGGTLYVYGRAGDRFAVRNSGATAVTEGVGLHACEYMTRGTVVILGDGSKNMGAGMSGGKIYHFEESPIAYNSAYIKPVMLTEEEEQEVLQLVQEYLANTHSLKAKRIITTWAKSKALFKLYVPLKEVERRQNSSEPENRLSAAG